MGDMTSTLASLCDTFVPPVYRRQEDPHGFWARAASDFGVPAVLELMLSEPGQTDRNADIHAFIQAMEERGFAEMSLDERNAAVLSEQRFANAVQQLKGMCLTLFYGLCDGTGGNPNWPAIRYPGPQPLTTVPRRAVEPVDVDALADVLHADACVIGSGAGGGVIAAMLAESGLEVVVLEMGDDFAEPDFDQRELTAYQNLYYRGGPFPTEDDGQITILAGSTLGGGTTVNWSNCIAPPSHVRHEWAHTFGLEGLDGSDFDQHLQAVIERISISTDCSDWNGPNQRLIDGCQALGYSSRRTARNADAAVYEPESAGFIGYGDRSGSKQGTAQTYLRDAADRGATIVVQCRAERILVKNGRAVGVVARVSGEVGGREVIVHTERVIVGGGALESPALLLRSDIGGPAVGRHLKLQPGAGVVGVYPEHQQIWWGAPQTALCDEFADLGDGYGFLIECGGANAGLGAAAQPWISGEQHKEFMARVYRVAPFIFFIRDHGEGRVELTPKGEPRTIYRLEDERDRCAMQTGLVELARIHRAAGAEEIYPAHRKLLQWRRGEDLNGYLAALSRISLGPVDLPLYATHLLSSCRMGEDPQLSVADPRGELHDVRGVWIADASAFPSAPGVNPMLTTMALARRTATMILQS
jgi:choline dehydrogenase-like flavoprotein